MNSILHRFSKQRRVSKTLIDIAIGARAKWSAYRKIKNEASLEEIQDIWIKYHKHSAFLNYDERSYYLLNILKPHIKKDYKILELGSGTGRNLHHLISSDYKNVFGIEISPKAIALMKKNYSEVLNVWNDSIECKIKNFKNGEFDIVFSMLVLMHIHRDSEWIFDEIVRITKRYLITIEEEATGGKGRKHLPRNFKNIFEPLGMIQIEEDVYPQLNDRQFITRVFAHESEESRHARLAPT